MTLAPEKVIYVTAIQYTYSVSKPSASDTKKASWPS